MKKISLPISISLAMLSTAVLADYPDVVINNEEIVLNYDKEIDIDTVIPQAHISDEADVTVSAFNHDVDINAKTTVSHNRSLTGDVKVEATGVGNNVAVELSGVSNVIGSVTGNQWSDISATTKLENNHIHSRYYYNNKIEVSSTAVGNNLSVEGVDDAAIALGSVAFNYDTNISASTKVKNNHILGVEETTVSATAVGNNTSVVTPHVNASIVNVNRNVNIAANTKFSGNYGNIGAVTVNSTAVGNNISIKPVKVDAAD